MAAVGHAVALVALVTWMTLVALVTWMSLVALVTWMRLVALVDWMSLVALVDWLTLVDWMTLVALVAVVTVALEGVSVVHASCGVLLLDEEIPFQFHLHLLQGLQLLLVDVFGFQVA